MGGMEWRQCTSEWNGDLQQWNGMEPHLATPVQVVLHGTDVGCPVIPAQVALQCLPFLNESLP